MKKILLSLSIIGLIFTGVNAKNINLKPTQILGEVNGQKFTVLDWNTEFLSLDPKIRQQGTNRLFTPLRNRIIENLVLSKVAKQQNIHKTEAFKAAMRKAERDILSRLYIDKRFQGKISQSDLQKEYILFKEEIKSNYQVKARHILVKKRNKAEKILKALKVGGADFISLAKSHSKGPSGKNGGDLGWFGRGQMVPEFDKVVFALKDGELAKKPVKTQFGWHIIKREKSRKNNKVPNFKDVEQYLIGRIRQKQANKVIQDAIKKSKIVIYDENGKPIK